MHHHHHHSHHHYNHRNHHHQIAAALEFSVPSVPSLVSEDLGAPLFLGGYKVLICELSLSQNYLRYFYYFAHPTLQGSCEYCLAAEIKGRIIR